MKKEISVAIAAIIVMSAFMSAGLLTQVVRADTLWGGSSFDTATPITIGHHSGGEVISETPQFFHITNVIKAGQKITIKLQYYPTPSAYMEPELSIYDEDGKKLATVDGGLTGDPGSITLFWIPNSNKDVYNFYAVVSASYVTSAGDRFTYSLDISIEDCYDADSQTDAGDDFDKAIKISSGSYRGFLSGSFGNDHKDIYLVSLNAGDKLNIKLTPKSDAEYDLSIYNEDRKEAAHTWSESPGVIARLSWAVPSSQDIYFGIEPRHRTGSREYSFDVSVEAGAVPTSTPTPTPTPTETPATPTPTKPAWTPSAPANAPLLTISQTILKEEPKVGEETLVKVSLLNRGGATAKNILLSESIPSSVSVSHVSGAYSTGNIVTWSGELEKGKTHSVQHTFKMLEVKDRAVPVTVTYEDSDGNEYEASSTIYIATKKDVPAVNIDSDGDGVPDEYDYAPLDPKVQTKPKAPAFEAVFAIAGLFAVAYLLRRRG